MALDFDVTHVDSTASLVCSGVLDASSAPRLAAAVDAARGDANLITLDLTKVHWIDGDGLRALLEAVGRSEVKGAAVRLTASEIVARAAAEAGVAGVLGLERSGRGP